MGENKVVFKFGGYDLFKTMDLHKWGKCNWINDSIFTLNRLNSKATYHVTIYKNYNDV